MALQSLDFDKVAAAALRDIGAAMDGWLGGQPHDETAFLNRITEILSRRRRTCDVGTTAPTEMRSEVAVLHRRGPSQTDHYGSDLAVTIDVPTAGFLKTAFFQLKRSRDFNADLERRQFDDARAVNAVWERSYVAAIDEARGAIRIESASIVAERFGPNTATHRQRCDDWHPLTHWLWLWLGCEVGPRSDRNDPNGVEPLLQTFRVQPPTLRFFGAAPDIDYPEDWLPSRSWLNMTFTTAEPRSTRRR